jgi:nucleotide-binding universal stress UspA family protein
MIKTILTPAGGAQTDTGPITAALAVARAFGAHIDMLHVRFDPTEMAMALANDGVGFSVTQGLIDQLEREASDRQAGAQRLFARFCKRESVPVVTSAATAAGTSAEWHVETGQEARWMTRYGLAADLIVVSGCGAERGDARSTLEAVLLDTGRPLLIPAADAPFAALPKTIAIGWKPTAQAARAVGAALPLLSRAEKIIAITVAEDGAQHDADRLLRHLRWHGIEAGSEVIAPDPDGAAQTLLACAERNGAGLLVMGGYGHSRLREWVFGGMTQRVLTNAPMVVLMTH